MINDLQNEIKNKMLNWSDFRLRKDDPQKYKGMAMEKIEIGKCLSELPVGDANRIVGLSGTKGVLTTPLNIAEVVGCSYCQRNFDKDKWYRIAIGGMGNFPSSGMFNIGHVYGTAASRNILLHAFASGYGDMSIVNKIAGSNLSPISKVRVLYKNNIVESESMLDVCAAMPSANTYQIAAFGLISFKLQTPVEVSADIPAGYSVKEFAF